MRARSGSSRQLRSAERGLGALVAIKVAQSLYRRWEGLPEAERDRLASIASDVKERALGLRGLLDRSTGEAELNRASERLAGGIVGSADADPEVDDAEVARLRSELARELGRLADQSQRRAA
jgi:hypothetical protein